jgi:hypothetical protein
LEKGEPKSLFAPARVTDRSDPQLVHLDGLNLSRAWCMQAIAAALPQDDPARGILADSAARHREAALPHVASGDYMGEHWLATFAVYLLSLPSRDGSDDALRSPVGPALPVACGGRYKGETGNRLGSDEGDMHDGHPGGDPHPP